ncbi:MAG: ABC transporter ATP-binding protein [Oscillospiraceae bacterium]|nr:ABC transporter ATP-binding protein [Oscillospiraceae bacterium]
MLSFENLRAGYGEKNVLLGVDFRLAPHTITAVVGKNGSGKSTLVSCVNQEIGYTGRICFGDQNIALLPPKERAKLLGILPQSLERPRVLVEELVGFGRSPYLDIGKRFSRADREAVQKAIEDAGIGGLCGRRVDELSGGERQLAYLAMVLAQNTRVVILDETTTFLDIEREAAFLRKLEELKTRHKKTVLVILHNLSQAVQFADNIVILQEGKIHFEGSREQCLKAGAMERAFSVQRYEAEGRIFFAGQ